MTEPLTVDDWTVTEPGVVIDMPNDVYHADPVPQGSLSVSGAKKLLPPSCPALFKWDRDHGQAPKDVFDFGSAAHALLLGAGAEIEVVEADNWLTKAAKEARDAARMAGKTPLLRKDYEQVRGMADALHKHPIASALLSDGIPEVSAFWQDIDSAIWRRCRFDWLPEAHDGRLIVPDYKTAASANPDKFARAAADFGYHMQDAWYRDAIAALGLAEDAAFVFVVQEKTAPYLVSVCELDDDAIRLGREKNAEALAVYADCTARDEWPGYTEDVALVSLPRWAA